MKCPVCGKMFDVLYPQLWRYRRDGRYICSFSCVRLIDKGETKMEKFTKEQRAEAIRIALEGGNPKEYLRSIGSTSPDNLWYYMKGQLRKNDPETYEQLAKVAGAKKPAEKAPVLKVDGALQIRTKAPEDVKVIGLRESDTDIVKMEKELKFAERCVVSAIRVHGLGEFYMDKKHGTIDWRNEYGDETSMGPGGWIQMVGDLPMILKRLGVEL